MMYLDQDQNQNFCRAMNQETRQDLIHMIITGRGNGTMKDSVALRFKKMIFAEPLRDFHKKRRAEAQAEAERAAEALYEADIAKHGRFYMEVWSRDCDMVESTHLSWYESVKELRQSQEGCWEDAEGPITWTYISPESANHFEPSQRDRIMENFENGGDGFHLGI